MQGRTICEYSGNSGEDNRCDLTSTEEVHLPVGLAGD